MSEKREPGRPKDPNARVAIVATRLTEDEERELIAIARARRIKLAELLRRALRAVRQGTV